MSYMLNNDVKVIIYMKKILFILLLFVLLIFFLGVIIFYVEEKIYIEVVVVFLFDVDIGKIFYE